MSEASWSNYWQGREGDKTGALTGIESDQELQTHWAGILSDGPRDAPFLDLACGAGTLLKQAQGMGYTNLTGLDISSEAVSVLASTIPTVKTVIASAAKTELPDEAFAMIVSQFGVEYAEAEAGLIEAARLCREGGHIETVMHMAGGAIEAEVKEHEAHCKSLLASGFIEQAKAFFHAAYSGSTEDIKRLSNDLVTARKQVSTLVKPGQRSLAAHLIAGTAQLWDKRTAYAGEDVTAWLEGMKTEIKAYQSRMESMIAAALTKADLSRCISALKDRDFTVRAGPLKLSGADAAWALSALKKISS
ncbi:MAG: class I SAM-dependent methyltransferase [Pseudomonadota bacterium]